MSAPRRARILHGRGMCCVRTGVLSIFLLAACSGGGGDSAPSAAPPSATSPPGAAPSAGAPPGTPAEPPFTASALFVLGDSLSDVGNAAGAADYVLNLALDPPTVGLCNATDVLVLDRSCDALFYEQSRVSDGPVAVEHLAAHLGVPPLQHSLHVVPSRAPDATNYAVASAKARGPGSEDLARQVDWLLLDHAPLPTDAVVVVMIGGNDAIDALQAEVAATAVAGPRPSAAIVSDAVAAMGAAVERLLDFGARRIVVANVPDLAMLPAVRAAAQGTADEGATLAAAAEISAAFDRELDARLDGLDSSGRWLAPTPPVIERFDLRTALVDARAALAAAGGNGTDACFDSEAYRASSTAERLFHPDCAPPAAGAAPRFDGFVFWDGIHPTGAAHGALGAALAALF